MFIIPIENKPDWSRPPLATLALILLNLLVFVFYQGADPEKRQRAAETYQQLELAPLERPHYLDYLENRHPERYRHWQQLESQGHSPVLVQWLLSDTSFDAYLRDLWRERGPEIDGLMDWREKRRQFEAKRNEISVLEAGLIPAQPEPLDFLTSLFLHGGWGHLVGNMAFLFLFGFTLEAALRPWVYLGMYLAAGLAADALFLVFNAGSMVPVVGASGAISGLMGMYLALYRFRRIRFFYNVLFYFGELRAPALWVFPAWLAKELYGHFFVDGNTAYWAHIGGLLAGVAMVSALPSTRQRFTREQEQQSRDDTLTRELRRVQQQVAALEVDRARRQVELLCRRYPGDPRPWQSRFDLYKSQPSGKAFHQSAFAALRAFCQYGEGRDWVRAAESLVAEYRQLAPRAPALTGDLTLALSRRFWQLGERPRAEHYLGLALKKGARPAPLRAMVERVYQHYRKSSDLGRARQWREALGRLSDRPDPN